MLAYHGGLLQEVRCLRIATHHPVVVAHIHKSESFFFGKSNPSLASPIFISIVCYFVGILLVSGFYKQKKKR